MQGPAHKVSRSQLRCLIMEDGGKRWKNIVVDTRRREKETK